MWNLDRRRWEKGASASEMEAFIFLFCWSANALKGKEKSTARKADLEEEKSFYTRPHDEAYFTLWSGTSGNSGLLFIAIISGDMEDWSYAPMASHVCSPNSFSEENSIYFWQSFTDFSSCIICEESTCVIMDKVFHCLSVFFHCCHVSVSVKKTTLERDHCSDSRCQWRRGHRIRWTTGSFHQAPCFVQVFSNRLDILEKTPRWAVPRSVAPVSLNTGHELDPGEKV